MRFSLTNYYKPTPASIRKLADALLASSTFITASAMIADYRTLGMIALVIGAAAKFLSNFFCEGDDEHI